MQDIKNVTREEFQENYNTLWYTKVRQWLISYNYIILYDLDGTDLMNHI